MGVLDRRGHVGLVQDAGVGSGLDDLIDAVLDVVGQGDIQAGEAQQSSADLIGTC